jgi:hypothetical protein
VMAEAIEGKCAGGVPGGGRVEHPTDHQILSRRPRSGL